MSKTAMSDLRYRAFGLEIDASFPLPGMQPLQSEVPADLALGVVGKKEVERRWSGAARPPVWQTRFSDDTPFRLERGGCSDHLMTYGDRASFHLSPSRRDLACAPLKATDRAWQRQLLDTVLVCVSSLHGFELLHASAVKFPEGAVAFVALTGGGKTTLAAELLRRGHQLFADDIVALERGGERITAHPGPPLMNLPLAGRAAREFRGSDALFADENEAWVAIENASGAPAPLAAAYLLDRRAAVSTRIDRLTPNPLHLLPHTVGLSRDEGRYRRRFEFYADVAERTPLYRLNADSAASAETLATLVESSVFGVAANAEVV